MKTTVVIFLVFLLFSCTTTLETPPNNTENMCAIFAEKQDWLAHSQNSAEKWDLPIHIQMAIMQQESHFVADAKPPREKILGFIAGTRPSSAYGYAQALDGTWQEYLKSRQNTAANRDNFADACDFTGWYCHLSYRELGISKLDAYNLYLAYHEGNAGYKRKTHLNKPWLLNVAKKVARTAQQYQQQLEDCGN